MASDGLAHTTKAPFKQRVAGSIPARLTCRSAGLRVPPRTAATGFATTLLPLRRAPAPRAASAMPRSSSATPVRAFARNALPYVSIVDLHARVAHLLLDVLRQLFRRERAPEGVAQVVRRHVPETRLAGRGGRGTRRTLRAASGVPARDGNSQRPERLPAFEGGALERGDVQAEHVAQPRREIDEARAVLR